MQKTTTVGNDSLSFASTFRVRGKGENVGRKSKKNHKAGVSSKLLKCETCRLRKHKCTFLVREARCESCEEDGHPCGPKKTAREHQGVLKKAKETRKFHEDLTKRGEGWRRKGKSVQDILKIFDPDGRPRIREIVGFFGLDIQSTFASLQAGLDLPNPTDPLHQQSIAVDYQANTATARYEDTMAYASSSMHIEPFQANAVASPYSLSDSSDSISFGPFDGPNIDEYNATLMFDNADADADLETKAPEMRPGTEPAAIGGLLEINDEEFENDDFDDFGMKHWPGYVSD